MNETKAGSSILRQNNEIAQNRIHDILKRLHLSSQGSLDVTELSDMSHRSARALEDQWPTINPDIRVKIVNGMINDAQSIDRNYERSFVSILKVETIQSIRFDVLNSLSDSQDIFLLDMLFESVTSEISAQNRLSAVKILGNFALLAEYGELSQQRTQILTKLLAEMHTGDPDFTVRLEALVSLAYISDFPFVRLLVGEMYETDDEDYLVAAARAMGRQADTRWDDHISTLIGHDDPDVRLEAVKAAGRIESEIFVPLLFEVVDDDEPYITECAIDALGEIGSAEAIKYLTTLSHSESQVIRAAASRALDVHEDAPM